jgi:hypothetical protein
MTSVSRRAFLGSAAALGISVPQLRALDALAVTPARLAAAQSPAKSPRQSLPDIQFDIGDYVSPAHRRDGVVMQFPPVYTSYTTFALTRTPTLADQATLASALDTVEQAYPFGPKGVFTTVGYGMPYFARLPGGTTGPLVSGYLPRMVNAPARFAFEEAVPGPTDVGGSHPTVSKQTFNVPVRIEANDLVVMLRSDSASNLSDVIDYLTGASGQLAGRSVGASGLGDLLTVTSRRLMFIQQGLPRQVAEANGLPYAGQINPDSPMWMGFADQQASGSGPAEITTFAGNASSRLTTANPGDYFDNAAIMHLSHVIEDLGQFYAPTEPYTERVQNMFRSNPIPSGGSSDQFTDGGGPAILENTFQGTQDAAANAAGASTYQGGHRLGHLSTLQRSSRAADGTPIHIRADGPGFDSLDVPDGSAQPKLQFCIFMPTADSFRVMRLHQASNDLATTYNVDPSHAGLERFITTTRRQNFLVPPRRHRAFPLLEAAPASAV